MSDIEIARINEKSVVLKPNPILTGKLSDGFTSRELDIFAMIFSVYDLNSKKRRVIRLKIIEMLNVLGITQGGKNYKMFDEVTSRLLSRAVHIRSEEKEKFIKYNIFSFIEYNSKNGYIDFALSSDILPFIDELKSSQYTTYMLIYYLTLPNTYSKFLYEFLVQFKHINNKTESWERYISIDDLRGVLDIQDGDYQKYSHLKARCIIDTIESINKITDLNVYFEEVKQQRKITGLKFFVSKKKVLNQSQVEFMDNFTQTVGKILVDETESNKEPTKNSAEPNTLILLKKYGVKEPTASLFSEQYEEPYIKFVIRKVEDFSKTEIVREKPALLITYIKNKTYLEDYKNQLSKIMQEQQEKDEEQKKIEQEKLREKAKERYQVYYKNAVETFLSIYDENKQVEIMNNFIGFLEACNLSPVLISQAKKSGFLSKTVHNNALEFLNINGANILSLEQFLEKK